jgi:hypothetical protein
MIQQERAAFGLPVFIAAGACTLTGNQQDLDIAYGLPMRRRIHATTESSNIIEHSVNVGEYCIAHLSKQE